MDTCRRQTGLDQRWAPLVLGVATALLTWYLWGSLRQFPLIADEAAYLLQSEIFARGRWTAPAPPFPEFFEQSYVLLRPAVAAKYPPGHSLLLAAGTAVGLPGLVTVLLCGITGALVFALARHAAGGWVGLLTWVIWASTIEVIRWHPTYLSEVTTGALWLAGWWGLLRWRESGEPRGLLTAAAAAAWCIITRPLTGVAFAIPIAVVAARDVLRRRAWRELVIPALAATAILGIIPLWSARTTGDWRLTPLIAYTRAYMPSDLPGFGLSQAAPEIRLPPDQDEIEQVYRIHRQRHTLGSVPATLLQRLTALGNNFCGSGWRLVLLPFLLVGLFGLDRRGRFALLAAGLQVLLYLTYAHPPRWTVYYLEIIPVPAFVAATGLWAAMRRVRGIPAPALAGAAAFLLALGLARSHDRVRRALRDMRTAQVRFAEVMAALPAERAIVFVRYAPNHYPHLSFVRNRPFFNEASRWFAYDRGTENARLIAAAPDRVPFLADESTERIVRLAPDGVRPLP